jgi:hypothetical protein
MKVSRTKPFRARVPRITASCTETLPQRPPWEQEKKQAEDRQSESRNSPKTSDSSAPPPHSEPALPSYLDANDFDEYGYVSSSLQELALEQSVTKFNLRDQVLSFRSLIKDLKQQVAELRDVLQRHIKENEKRNNRPRKAPNPHKIRRPTRFNNPEVVISPPSTPLMPACLRDRVNEEPNVDETIKAPLDTRALSSSPSNAAAIGDNVDQELAVNELAEAQSDTTAPSPRPSTAASIEENVDQEPVVDKIAETRSDTVAPSSNPSNSAASTPIQKSCVEGATVDDRNVVWSESDEELFGEYISTNIEMESAEPQPIAVDLLQVANDYSAPAPTPPSAEEMEYEESQPIAIDLPQLANDYSAPTPTLPPAEGMEFEESQPTSSVLSQMVNDDSIPTPSAGEIEFEGSQPTTLVLPQILNEDSTPAPPAEEMEFEESQPTTAVLLQMVNDDSTPAPSAEEMEFEDSQPTTLVLRQMSNEDSTPAPPAEEMDFEDLNSDTLVLPEMANNDSTPAPVLPPALDIELENLQAIIDALPQMGDDYSEPIPTPPAEYTSMGDWYLRSTDLPDEDVQMGEIQTGNPTSTPVQETHPWRKKAVPKSRASRLALPPVFSSLSPNLPNPVAAISTAPSTTPTSPPTTQTALPTTLNAPSAPPTAPFTLPTSPFGFAFGPLQAPPSSRPPPRSYHSNPTIFNPTGSSSGPAQISQPPAWNPQAGVQAFAFEGSDGPSQSLLQAASSGGLPLSLQPQAPQASPALGSSTITSSSGPPPTPQQPASRPSSGLGGGTDAAGSAQVNQNVSILNFDPVQIGSILARAKSIESRLQDRQMDSDPS